MQKNEINSIIQSDNARHPILILVGCLVISGAVCYAHILGNTVVLALCLIAFLAYNVYACFKSTIFPVLLYFLPWSPLLKIDINGYSVFALLRTLSMQQSMKPGSKGCLQFPPMNY